MRPTDRATTSQAPTRADGVAWPGARPSLPDAPETASDRVARWTLGAIARARVELGLAPMERGAREVVACSPGAMASLMRGEAGPWGTHAVARAIRRAVQAHRQAVACQLVARPSSAAVEAHLALRAMPTTAGRAFLPALGRRWHGPSSAVVAPRVVVAPVSPAVPVPPTCASANTVDLAAERATVQAEHARRQARRLAECVRWSVMVADVLTSACVAPRAVVAVPPSVRLAAIAAHARSLVESSPAPVCGRGNGDAARVPARI